MKNEKQNDVSRLGDESGKNCVIQFGCRNEKDVKLLIIIGCRNFVIISSIGRIKEDWNGNGEDDNLGI